MEEDGELNGSCAGGAGCAQGVGSSCWDMVSSIEESPPVIRRAVSGDIGRVRLEDLGNGEMHMVLQRNTCVLGYLDA